MILKAKMQIKFLQSYCLECVGLLQRELCSTRKRRLQSFLGVTALVSTELPQGFAWPRRYVFHADSVNCAVIFVVSSNHSGTRFQPHGRNVKAIAELESLSKKLLGGQKGFLFLGKPGLRKQQVSGSINQLLFFALFFFFPSKSNYSLD